MRCERFTRVFINESQIKIFVISFCLALYFKPHVFNAPYDLLREINAAIATADKSTRMHPRRSGTASISQEPFAPAQGIGAIVVMRPMAAAGSGPSDRHLPDHPYLGNVQPMMTDANPNVDYTVDSDVAHLDDLREVDFLSQPWRWTERRPSTDT